MTKLKKVILLILCVMIVTPCINIYAENTDYDIRDTKYYEAAMFFKDLGVISDLKENEFLQDVGISRAEFAIMLSTVLGHKGNDFIGDVPFSDVSDDNPAKNSIAFLYSCGVMQGTSGDTFAPNDGVTYETVAKSIMIALGYHIIAGSDEDYISYIAETGISKGIAIDGRNALRGDTCLMLFRALDVPLIEKSYDGKSIIKGGSKTILSEYLKTDIYTGIVTATNKCRLYDDEEMGKNQITINYVKYDCTLNNNDSFVGHNVKYYVRKADNTEQVIAIFDKSQFSKVISYDDILDTTDYTKIDYIQNNKNISKSIEKEAFFIYNGRELTNLANASIIPQYGEMEIIDNDGNGRIDVVIIRDYKIYQIEAASSLKKVITFKDTDYVIDTSADGVYCIRDGIECSLSDIKRDEVASVMTDCNGRQTIVFISSQSVSGKVTAVDSAENIVAVEGKEYKTTPYLQEVSSGMNVYLYLDHLGNAAFWKQKRELSYGWLISTYTEESGQDTYIRIFTEQGRTESLKLKEKVTLYRGNSKNGAIKAENLKAVLLPSQMIKYKTNGNNDVSEIYLYVDVNPGDFGCEGFVRNICSTGRCFYNIKGYINDQYNPKEKSALLDEDTVIFRLDNEKDQSKWTIEHITDYKVSDYFEKMQVFDISEFGIASCVMVYDTEYQTFSATDPIILVNSNTLTINNDDEEICVINGICQDKGADIDVKTDNPELLSNRTAIAVKKNVPLSNVKKGDIIQCHIDLNNNISSWRLLHSLGDTQERALFISSNTETPAGTEYGGLGYFGPIDKVNENGFTISSATLPKNRAYKFIDNDYQVLLRYNNGIEKIEKSDVHPGMQMYLYIQPESGRIFMVAYE